MKSKIFTLVLLGILIVPMSFSYGFIGFGLTVGQEMATVDGVLESMDKSESGLNYTTSMDRMGFEDPILVGGYLYLDFIPVIDLEVDFQLAIGEYDFEFYNTIVNPITNATDVFSTGLVPFAYARGSFYLTARKKLFGVGVPILGGIKLHAGGGLNFHSTAPYASIDMMEELLGDDLYESFDQAAMEDKIITYMEDNLESQAGIHFQAGIQLKLLILDTFINYRYTIAKDVYLDQGGFGALNIRIGMGI